MFKRDSPLSTPNEPRKVKEAQDILGQACLPPLLNITLYGTLLALIYCPFETHSPPSPLNRPSSSATSPPSELSSLARPRTLQSTVHSDPHCSPSRPPCSAT